MFIFHFPNVLLRRTQCEIIQFFVRSALQLQTINHCLHSYSHTQRMEKENMKQKKKNTTIIIVYQV